MAFHRLVVRALVAPLVLGMTLAAASAQEATVEDLKQAPPARQVLMVGFCHGRYEVKFKDGSARQFKERDLRFATGSGPLGPGTGHGVLVPTGRMGDQALVIFSDPDELRSLIRKTC